MVFAVIFVLLSFFIFSIIQTAMQSYELRQHYREISHEINLLQAKKDVLEGLDKYLMTDEYIEAYAREYYDLAYPGEISVEINAIEPLTNNRSVGEAWWEPIFSQ
tara:strand:- start:1574 stop:1888 length:315 start_codon:yes stop_codon:yes gene_type:complete